MKGLRSQRHQVVYEDHVQMHPYRGILRKAALKICSKFTGEHSCRRLISIKLRGNFIEITLWHGCSPVNMSRIFGTRFYKNIYGRLLLHVKLWSFNWIMEIYREGHTNLCFLRFLFPYYYLYLREYLINQNKNYSHFCDQNLEFEAVLHRTLKIFNFSFFQFEFFLFFEKFSIVILLNVQKVIKASKIIAINEKSYFSFYYYQIYDRGYVQKMMFSYQSFELNLY